ncbi:hypothetical protein GGR88_002003 [Sphingomonas jejuensis]|uniref:Peptidase M14 domain-containing protein n=1 Tax=Sphingomonas jejuensis TaxID=904715 RepID=A0ABX0XMM6_9SPHN|nr:M14 family zinc carboxypeptidase [Sphingomonas jejuensis]NJC34489.1 hypothetical protein [Sphingomonas jejuensis]
MLRTTFAAALLAASALASLPGATATAQTSYYFPDAAEGELDPAIPTPEAFLGYPIGSRYTRHDRLVAYFQELARLSPRFRVEEIGQSYEGRPLLSVLVTSPANHGRIDAIRQAHATLADPAAPPIDANEPVVINLSYSVHGNETSSGEAALLTAYYLAAARSDRVAGWLDRSVIVMDPAQNPDGRDRAANWHNAWRNDPPIADPFDKEHVEPFPNGRTNHYFTDLNRDWLAVTQVETPPKLAIFHRWLPNVMIDFHEMGSGSTYYLEPTPESNQSALLPKSSYDANLLIARYQARALDRLGSLYYTRENFDNFSPVYGSTYPDFHGGVGATVEQASSRGLVQDTAGGLLEFRFTIRNQLAVGLATIDGAVAERAALFDLQKSFFRSAVEEGRRYRTRAFVFGDPDDPGLTRRMVELLLTHRIQVHRLAAPVTIDGVRYEPGSAFAVPSAQPQFRLVRAIFEETPPVSGVVYGSTSYSIAQAYTLRFGGARSLGGLGDPVTETPPLPTAPLSASSYAYAIDWRDVNAPRALAALLKKDVRVRAAFGPFSAATDGGDVGFGRGTLVVPVGGQALDGDALRQAVADAAAEAGVAAHALAGGLSASGIDLGSDSVRAIRSPRVAMVMGEGVSAAEIGSTWFALGERLHWPATRLDPAQVGRVPLEPYTTLVLASGGYEGWSDTTVTRLRRWIEGGGSLITFGTASRWAVEQGLAGTTAVEAPDVDEAVAAAAGGARLDFDARRDALGEARTSGNAISADVDPTHPLAFGLTRRDLFVNKESDVTLPPVSDPFSNVVAIDSDPGVNGYLSRPLRDRFAGSVWAQVARLQNGNVVLFADDPAYRKYWLGTERLLINAVFLGNHLTPSTRR